MKSGARIEGVAKNENNYSVQVLGRDEKLHLITSDEMASLKHGTRSLMPVDAAERLSKDEFQDLVAFLARQTRRSR